MIKKLFFALLTLTLWTPQVTVHSDGQPTLSVAVETAAAATNLHPDPGMDTPSAAMLDPVTGGNPWTISGSKANGNNAKKMQMLMWMVPCASPSTPYTQCVKKGHDYAFDADITGMTHGTAKVGLGLTMSGTKFSSYIPYAGSTPIADNFTTSAGLTTYGSAPATYLHDSPTGDVNGAFRIGCDAGDIATNDSVVYPDQPGAAHVHQFFGNTLSSSANGSYAFYRTHGSTTCGNVHTNATPIDRAAYWAPCMMTSHGDCVKPWINLYYKREGNTTVDGPSSRCNNPADPLYVPGPGGNCGPTPQGARWISGKADGTAPAGTVGHFECWGVSDVPGGRSNNLSDFFHGHCAKRGEGGNAPGQGGVLAMMTIMGNCWDGVNLDTPNHDAVIYPTRNNGSFFGGCPADHPYRITSPQPQFFWLIDDDFVAGGWHCSSDEMVAGAMANPCITFHIDFTNSWSPAGQAAWEANCQDRNLSCSSGDLGNGTQIESGGKLRSNGGNEAEPSSISNGTVPPPSGRYESTARAGLGRPITSNQHFHQVITAAADGRISIMGIEDAAGNGFDGKFDNIVVAPVR